MTERLPKSVFIGGFILGLLVLAYAAFSRPGYFTDQTYLGGLILLEFVVGALWFYRRIFFPVVILAFVLAGVDLPVGTVWNAARWVFLGAGAFAGFFIMLKERGYRFRLFHAVALFAVLTALVSAAVSRYPSVALLKVLSLFLLFLYAGTGARLAVTGRENRFFRGLLLGCEIFVAVIALLHVAGIDAMGNPNSLGAVMGVVCAPILLWGILLGGDQSTLRRLWVLYAASMIMAFVSHARAGMVAALIGSGLLCLALRRYALAIEGTVVLLIVMAATAIFRPEVFTSLTSDVVYKGGHQDLGLLASRESPWRAATESIRDHPWFGRGMGTTADGTDANAPDSQHGRFSSSMNETTENGSSYLAIVAGVGVLGVVPFALLLVLLVGMVFRTIAWMRQSMSAAHPAVPLATVIVAAMFHAAFEDWLFAPGYYMCVFFWSLAFVFVDVAPRQRVPGFALRWSPKRTQGAVGVVVPTR